MASGIYTTPGTDTFVVPSGVSAITVRVWGAGGGGGGGGIGPTGDGDGGPGYAGGFAKSTISVTAGETLNLSIGGGGGGGEGAGAYSGAGGGGGGMTGIFRGAIATRGNALLVAGGGGGGGGGDNSSSTNGGTGGGGGGDTGDSGGASSDANGGGGGTQSAGGAGGSGTGTYTAGEAGETDGTYHGGDGAYHSASGADATGGTGGTQYGGAGGDSDSNGFGGGAGGGAGYYGGGGGCSSCSGDAGGGGGGGGSNEITGSDTTNTQATGQTPPATDDDYYDSSYGGGGNGGAQGGNNGTAGEGGRIVITWDASGNIDIIHSASSLTFNPITRPNIYTSLGKSVDSWCGAIPIYVTPSGIDHETYPYCRVKITNPISTEYYVDVTWDSDDSRFEGTIYPGSNYGEGCADPDTGTFVVSAELSSYSDFDFVPYKSDTTFDTYVTRRKTSKGTDYDYCDPVPSGSGSDWHYSISDFVIYADQARSDCAIAIPFLPTTSAISNITVNFDGSPISSGTAESESDAWWWENESHTLYLQKSSIDTNEVDVDITFDSDTDLWATRFDRVQTGDMGSRLFYNGIFISNQYLTTSVYGGGHNQTGMQAESRAHLPGEDELSTDCMERTSVHVDDTIRTDSDGSYSSNIKWSDNWEDRLIYQDNGRLVVEVTSSPTGWQQQVDTSISCKRTQVFMSGVAYIRNTYEFTNNDTSSHNYPFVWQREQWLGSDRDTNDRARFSGDTEDIAIDAEESIINLSEPWMVAYDSGVLASTGVVFKNADASTSGLFTESAFITAGSPYAYWPVPIEDRSTTVAENIGFYHTFEDVEPSGVVSISFLHFSYVGTSRDDILSKIASYVGTYQLAGVTKDIDGNISSSGDCYLFKLSADKDNASFIDYYQSDISGNYDFSGITDNDSQYFVIGFKDGSPNVMDATDHVLTPIEE